MWFWCTIIEAKLQSVFIKTIKNLAFVATEVMPDTDASIIKSHVKPKAYGVTDSDHFQLFFELDSDSNSIDESYSNDFITEQHLATTDDNINSQVAPVAESGYEQMPCQCICVPENQVVDTSYHQSLVLVSNKVSYLPCGKVADPPHEEVADPPRKEVADPPREEVADPLCKEVAADPSHGEVADPTCEDLPCEISQFQEADGAVDKQLVGLKSSLAEQLPSGKMIIRGTAVLLMPYSTMDTSSKDSMYPEFTYQYSIDELTADTGRFVKWKEKELECTIPGYFNGGCN